MSFYYIVDGSDLAIAEEVKSSNLVLLLLRNQTPLELSLCTNFRFIGLLKCFERLPMVPIRSHGSSFYTTPRNVEIVEGQDTIG